MPILTDCHLHTSHSGDSDSPMEEMILQGISQGLTTMCFTEHNDFDFPVTEMDPAGKFELNTDAYLYDLIRYKEKYADKIRILFGVELGLQPWYAGRILIILSTTKAAPTRKPNGSILNPFWRTSGYSPISMYTVT